MWKILFKALIFVKNAYKIQNILFPVSKTIKENSIMKIKKFLYIMSLALIISLSSCNKNEANNSSLTSDNSTEASKVIISGEDDISVIDSSSEDNNNSKTWISENDSNSGTSDNNDNSNVSEPDNSSVSAPDDNSNISESDNSTASTPDDNSSFSEPDKNSASVPDDNSNVSEPDNSSVSTPDDSSSFSEPDNNSASVPDDSSVISEPDSSINIPSINDNSSLSDILKAILSNDNVNSFNGIMKNFVKDYLSGQDTLFIREFSSGSTRLFDLSISDISVIDSAICVEPYEGPIEYCCYLIKLIDGADKQSVKAEVLSSMNKSYWGCITAEKAIVIDSGNVILALMASEAETDAYVKAFKEVMVTTGTVLSK